MNTPTTNPTTSSNRWVYFSRMIRRFLGVPLSAGLTAALLFVGIMAGCKEDEGTVVGVFDNTPPLAGSIAPGCGATGVALNQKVSITFTEAVDPSTLTTSTFTLAGPSGSPVPGTVAYVSATGIATFSPASNLAASTTYTYTVIGGSNGVKDMSGNALPNNFGCSFTTGVAADVTPPTVVSTNPANNATGVPLSKVSSKGSARSATVSSLNKTNGVAAGKIITATFSEAMDPLTINLSTFTVTGPGSTPVIGTVTYAGPSFTATFIAASNLAPSTTYTGTITTGSKDLAGNALASNYVWSFTTGAAADVTPPTVISTDPANTATGVFLNKKIAVNFSEAMNPSTIDATTLTLKQGSTAVSGTVTYSGTSALFTPTSNLAANTLYTVTMSTGAKDLAGNALASNYVWSFTTGNVADNTPPTVISTNPANNAPGVSVLGRIITATFSEAVDPLTITSSTFTVTGPSSTPVAGTVAYAGPSFAATFIAASNLAPSTTYTGTITTGAKDLAGNAMVSNYVWTFTTSAAADVTPPTVLSTDPANTLTGVALNKKIAATFSEAMNASTITATTFILTQGTTSVSGAVTYTGTTALFSPASNLAPNTVYTATINTGAKDLAGNAIANNFVWNFTTGASPDITPPTVVSTDPANNATGVPLSKVAAKGSARGASVAAVKNASGAAAGKVITATFSEAMDPLTISLSTFTVTGPGATPVTGLLVAYAGQSFAANFIAAKSLAPNTTYTGTITTGAKDLAGNALANNYVWTFTTGAAADTILPTVISTDPVNNATGVALNKKITATFSEAMNPSSITATTFTLQIGTLLVPGAVTYTGTTALFSPSSNLTPNTVYTATVDISARDLAGNNLAGNYVWNFTTGTGPDITPPTVILTDPVNNATGVALNKKIAATFSETMDPSTITTTTFSLRQGIRPISGTLNYLGASAVFTPASNLASNTVYTATISTGAKDLAGNPLASDFVWNFTTGAAPDTTRPTVISTDPLNNATGVALNKKIVATFSEAMDQSTISTATVTVTGLGGASVIGTVNYAAIGNSMTFTPSSDLVSNTTYSVTVKGGATGAKDLAGNALINNYVWSFRTVDATPPTVISTDPLNNAAGVAVNKKIAATFSKAMDQSTISTATFTVTGPGSTVVTGSVTYVAATNSALFTPATNLAASTTYNATITTGAKDALGNALSSNYVWNFTTGIVADTSRPTVLSTDPINNAIDVVLNKIIYATFSKAMDPSTITAPGTFTLKRETTPVPGTVSYTSTTATFTPASNLAPNAVFTATITTSAKDLAGNALQSNYVWSFRTAGGVTPPSGQAPVNLGSAARFAILSSLSITNVPSSSITGDVGLYPGARSSLALTAPQVIGTIFAADDAAPVPAMLILAKTDALNAYGDAVAASRGTPTPISGNINGLTLVPGLYESGTSIEISPGGFLYLDGQGDVNAVFIIRSATSITTESTSEVVLTNGAQAKNIFWAAGSAVTLGTNSIFKGTIIASTSISVLTGANLLGRTIIQGAAAGSVILQQATIVRPPL